MASFRTEKNDKPRAHDFEETADATVAHAGLFKRPAPSAVPTTFIPVSSSTNSNDDDSDSELNKKPPFQDKRRRSEQQQKHQPEQQPQQQQQQRSALGVWVPDKEIRPVDILCGRDRASHAHAGNKHFRNLIGHYRAAYQSTRLRTEKTRITTEVVSQVKAYDGRFIKRNEVTNRWHQVSESYAHDKVSHALRSAKDSTIPRPKKKRKVVVPAPTKEEEALFRPLYAEQQQIFASLMAQPAEDDEQEEVGVGEAAIGGNDFDQADWYEE